MWHTGPVYESFYNCTNFTSPDHLERLKVILCNQFYSLTCHAYFHAWDARGVRTEENTYGECRQVFVSPTGINVGRNVIQCGKSNGLEHARRNWHLPDQLELATATHTRDTEKAVQEVISRAMLQLGDTELRSRQDHTIRRFLRGKGVFVCFPTISGKLLAWLTASFICRTQTAHRHWDNKYAFCLTNF